MPNPPPELRDRFERAGQQHVFRWWDDLSATEQDALARQLAEIDLDLIARLAGESDEATDTAAADRASRAAPPKDIIRQPRTETERHQWRQAAMRGDEMLRAGRVGAILVAGGQGTRLGFDRPKGTFPIGPVSGATLFRILAEQLLARSRRAGVVIPYYVMTSDATHAETVAEFEREDFYGLPPDSVRFFQQGSMPAVDARTGRLLMESRGRLATSPDGHGGMLAALERAGLIEDMRRRGVDALFYHQVDNPTVIMCDPALLGLHERHGSELSTKVVCKCAPEEKMGLLADVDGTTQIIEYSDLPDEIAAQREPTGELRLWCGNTAIHVFSRSLLERLTTGGLRLPFHRARKQVAHVDDEGRLAEPTARNAIKFEKFIFDALPLAKSALVVEADREREFNPVKNAEGADSPATSRAAIARIGREWLGVAGFDVPNSATVEIGPLCALDTEELRARAGRGDLFSGRVHLG